MQFEANDSAVLHVVSVGGIVNSNDAYTAPLTGVHYETLTRHLIIQGELFQGWNVVLDIFAEKKRDHSRGPSFIVLT